MNPSLHQAKKIEIKIKIITQAHKNNYINDKSYKYM